MEEALKAMNIGPKVLIRRSNAMWDILLENQRDSKDIGWEYPHHQDADTQKGIHGHPKDTDYSTEGSHVHHRGTF